jgi:hypothetical protein
MFRSDKVIETKTQEEIGNKEQGTSIVPQHEIQLKERMVGKSSSNQT